MVPCFYPYRNDTATVFASKTHASYYRLVFVMQGLGHRRYRRCKSVLETMIEYCPRCEHRLSTHPTNYKCFLNGFATSFRVTIRFLWGILLKGGYTYHTICHHCGIEAFARLDLEAVDDIDA